MADEPDNVKPIRSVAKAAESGDERELLLALRDRVALAINSPKCSARDLAPLTRRLQEISKDLRALDRRRADEGDAAEDEPWDDSPL
ncbi:hypothetical protein ABIA30_004744 [Mycobacterium sp. MAA66]|uniref:hypothetical protein n=1 Tax=Mycobacterium sp. MAA66 TaxID=3156297 RepID=UPI0035133A4A